jgi:hypothetical protein
MNKRGPAILFAAAVLSSIVQLIQGHAPPFDGYYEVVRVSRNLAETGEFANPFRAAATGATAHVAPLLPALLAGLIRLLGLGAAFYIAMVGLMIAAFALQAALLPAVSELLLGSRAPGLLAGAFAAVLPIFRLGAPEDCWFLGTWLLLFLLASRKAVDRFGAGRGGVLTGLLAGLLLLWSPVSLVVVAVWMVRLPPRASAVAALVAALVCAPWTVRNYRALNAFVFVRDNLGIELRVSNNDDATRRPPETGNPRFASSTRMRIPPRPCASANSARRPTIALAWPPRVSGSPTIRQPFCVSRRRASGCSGFPREFEPGRSGASPRSPSPASPCSVAATVPWRGRWRRF